MTYKIYKPNSIFKFAPKEKLINIKSSLWIPDTQKIMFVLGIFEYDRKNYKLNILAGNVFYKTVDNLDYPKGIDGYTIPNPNTNKEDRYYQLISPDNNIIRFNYIKYVEEYYEIYSI